MSAGPQSMSNEGVLGVEGVPGISADWYRGIVELAHSMPPGVQGIADVLSDGVLIAFGVLFLVAFWRARTIDTRAVVLAIAAPPAMVTAYLISELLKTFIREERPCRAVVGIPATVSECPEYGDWSLPSNHSTIAAAAAVALFFAWRRSRYFAPVLALVEGYSRVFVGAHYPHDVLAGFALGGMVAAGLMLATDRALVPWIVRVRAARVPASDTSESEPAASATTMRMAAVSPSDPPARLSGVPERQGDPVAPGVEHTVPIHAVETTRPIRSRHPR